MKIVLGVLLLILVLLQTRLWFGAGSIQDIARLEREIGNQEQENAGLEQRNQILKEEVSELRNGLDAIEERARSELGLIRKGETFFLIVDETGDNVVRSATLDTPRDEPGSFVASPESQPETPAEIAPEPPPELEVEYNPYLELFRDETDAGAGAE